MTAGDAAAPGRILLALGNLEAAQFAHGVLSRGAGFDVRLASDAAEALRRASDEGFDLVIADADLPGMIGMELLRRLRQIDAAVPVAVVTALPVDDGRDGAWAPDVAECLQKPLRPGQLIAAATALVRKGRAARLPAREVVLAIGAHPDDAEIGAGGTLLAHHAAGHQVAILTMTGGQTGGGPPGRRPAESAAAARILGADLYLEDLGDAMISEGDPTITAISRVVERVGPTILYTHSIHDKHQDHRNTHRAALVAGRGIGSVYCFQSPSATAEFGPSLFVGIDAQLPGKLAAVAALGSRPATRDHRRPDLITSTARQWGRFARARYAEAFEVVRDRAVRSGREPEAAG